MYNWWLFSDNVCKWLLQQNCSNSIVNYDVYTIFQWTKTNNCVWNAQQKGITVIWLLISKGIDEWRHLTSGYVSYKDSFWHDLIDFIKKSTRNYCLINLCTVRRLFYLCYTGRHVTTSKRYFGCLHLLCT